MRIYTNRKSSSFTHHIYYSFNGSSEVGLTSGVEDYYDWYFPDTLADNIPNVASATGYIRLYTFNNGTNIGNKTVSFTMQVNDDFLPSVTFEIADAEGYFEQYGKYIQGNSKVTGTISAEGCYGATIKSYKTTFDGKSYSDPEFTTDAIVNSGTQVISVSVTDSRGKTTIVENEVEIYEYKTPKITSVKAKRCTKDGASSSQGDYLSFIFSSKVTALDGLNPVIYSVEFRSISENSYTATILDGYENQHEVEDGNYIFAAEKEAYSIILTVADGFGYTQKKAIGPSVSVLFSRLWKGLGYAVGKFAELENVFDIGFKTRFSGGILCLVLEEGADLNETLTPNIYAGQDVGTAGYLNVPTDYAEGKFTLDVVSCGDNGELKQTFTTCSKENSQVYVRFYYDGEWGEWINQFAELNSNLSDLKTRDYIIEQGTSGIWTYRKWNSGIAECWGKFYVSQSCTNAWGSIYETSLIKLPDFPFTFAKTPHMQILFETQQGYAFIEGIQATTTTNAGETYLARGTSASNIYGYIVMTCGGRWK